MADRRLAGAFDAPSALAGLQALRAQLGAPRALRDDGFDRWSIPDPAAEIVPAVPDTNPVAVTTADLEQLLRQAWEGSDPG